MSCLKDEMEISSEIWTFPFRISLRSIGRSILASSIILHNYPRLGYPRGFGGILGRMQNGSWYPHFATPEMGECETSPRREYCCCCRGPPLSCLVQWTYHTLQVGANRHYVSILRSTHTGRRFLNIYWAQQFANLQCEVLAWELTNGRETKWTFWLEWWRGGKG